MTARRLVQCWCTPIFQIKPSRRRPSSHQWSSLSWGRHNDPLLWFLVARHMRCVPRGLHEDVVECLSRSRRPARLSQDEEFLVNQITRLGALSPAAPTSCSNCSGVWRLRGEGGEAGDMPLPVTHDTLAEALGLTAGNLKRAMSRLRRAGLLSWEYGHLGLIDPTCLRSLSGFRPPGTCSCGRMRMAPVGDNPGANSPN